MRSKFAIAGHPIHAMLVALPIGLFCWTLFADVVYLVNDRNDTWYDIAFWTGVGAIVTALIAALPGFGDYFTMARHSEARDIAAAHMVLNLTIVTLFIVAWALMLDGNAKDGGLLGAMVVLHAVGVGLLGLSGWLGGEMVYVKHLAMVPDDDLAEQEEQQRHERAPMRRRLFAPRRGH